MSAAAKIARAEPFFLQAERGQRFCLYHPAAGPCRGAVLYVHPFAEELNRARRMAALHARELAALGVGVLQIDLFGCGDSSGEFGEARWEIWQDDLARASRWLHARLERPVALWGLRLGALLALDYARQAVVPVPRLLLWQPVHHGAAFLTQFLRLRVAGDMLAGAAQQGTAALRAALAAGETLEIAGYDLAPEMAAAIDSASAAALVPHGIPVHWFEVVASPERPVAPALSNLLASWRAQGTDAQLQLVAGQPFWSTQENVGCDALLAASAAVWREQP
jgi:exosortase A-associated hydrolase 2